MKMRNGASIRHYVLVLVAALLSINVASAYGFTAEIDPPAPNSSDVITMKVSGSFATSGYSIDSVIKSQIGNIIYVDVNVIPPPPDAIVLHVVTSFSESVSLGTQAEGDYTYQVRLIFWNTDPFLGLPFPTVMDELFGSFTVMSDPNGTSVAPDIAGAWQSSPDGNTLLIIFGSNFTEGLEVYLDGVLQPATQLLNSDMMAALIPGDSVNGLLEVRGATGSDTIDVQPPSTDVLSITGVWSGKQVANLVLIFGSGFVQSETTVTVNGVYAPSQVLDPGLMAVLLPTAGAVIDIITVTTPTDAVTWFPTMTF